MGSPSSTPPSHEARATRLRELSTPSYPTGAAWDEPLRAAERDGRFRVAPEVNGSPQVIVATGFKHGFRHDPLLNDLVAAHELETHDHWIVLAPDSTDSRPHRRHPHAVARRRRRTVGVPCRRHDRRREVRRPRPPPPHMSYTLRGRIESRLASAVPALVVALALHTWWAIEVVALMLVIGLALDTLVYHRVLAYQPGWAAAPLGALELGLVYGAMRWLGIMAPLRWALVLYGIGWVAAQLCAQALFPRARLEYGEAGGELGPRRRR